MKAKLLTIAAAFLLVGALPKEEPALLVDNSIEGSWDLVSFTRDGRSFETLLRPNWTFRNGIGTVFVDGKEYGPARPYTVDLSRIPARLTWGTIHAIFAIEGDTMIYCISSTDDRWPSQFSTDGGFWVYRWKRRP